MVRIKKGDIVGRKSYNKDILFIVDRIIKVGDKKSIAVLKGLNIRIQADSDIEDLELIEQKVIDESERKLEKKFEARMRKYEKTAWLKRSNRVIYTGRILHLDGDRRYTEKSNMFYRKMGLKAIVKNIPENRQASVVSNLIDRYKPDILVITGHERIA